MFTYTYPHPAVTADIVVFAIIEARLSVLLIRRGIDPFRGQWALPGGFLAMEETIEACAARELAEETGVERAPLVQFGIFSDPGRDPRERVLSIAFLACVRADEAQMQAGTDAADVRWFGLDDLPALAFDHEAILGAGREQLRRLAADHPLVPRLMPPAFTLTELETMTEAIICEPIDKRTFRRHIEHKAWLAEAEGVVRGRHRPAQLYRLRETFEASALTVPTIVGGEDSA